MLGIESSSLLFDSIALSWFREIAVWLAVARVVVPLLMSGNLAGRGTADPAKS